MVSLVNEKVVEGLRVRVKTPQQAEKILAAAAELFATHRFHEARMEDVAALAEVGKGTLYRYFKDKEELYLALLERAARGLRDRLRKLVTGVGGPAESLAAVVRGLIDYFDEQPHLFDLIQHAEAMQRPGQQFPWQTARAETMALVKDILVTGARSGHFAIEDPELATLMLLGGLRAVYRFGARPRPRGLEEAIVGGFLAGHLRREPAPPGLTARPCEGPAAARGGRSRPGND